MPVLDVADDRIMHAVLSVLSLSREYSPAKFEFTYDTYMNNFTVHIELNAMRANRNFLYNRFFLYNAAVDFVQIMVTEIKNYVEGIRIQAQEAFPPITGSGFSTSTTPVNCPRDEAGGRRLRINWNVVVEHEENHCRSCEHRLTPPWEEPCVRCEHRDDGGEHRV